MDLTKVQKDTQTRIINALMAESVEYFAEKTAPTSVDQLVFCQKMIDDYEASVNTKDWLKQKVINYESKIAKDNITIVI